MHLRFPTAVHMLFGELLLCSTFSLTVLCCTCTLVNLILSTVKTWMKSRVLLSLSRSETLVELQESQGQSIRELFTGQFGLLYRSEWL